MNFLRGASKFIFPVLLGLATPRLHAQSFDDLYLTKTHNGNFQRGQIGATYTITATNNTSGTVDFPITVSESVPAGLTATSMQGTGWTCTQPAGPCIRGATFGGGNLPGGLSWPPIILTVNVAANAPPSVTNVVTLSGDSVTFNNTATDFTVIDRDPPTITSLGSSFLTSDVATFPAAITSGTPINLFKLYIFGNNFDPDFETRVIWFDPTTNVSSIFTDVVVGPNLITTRVPSNLFSTLVASPVNVQVRVEQFFTPPSAQIARSNIAIFQINPPLASLGPVLPAGVVGIPYSQPYFRGGTGPYQSSLLTGALPGGLAFSPDLLRIQGTPTTTGTFPFQPRIVDVWGNAITPNDSIQITAAAPLSITSVVPDNTAAGISSQQITVNGTGFFQGSPPGGSFSVPGSVVTWTAPNSSPVTLTTTFVSATQLTAIIPGNLLTTPLTAAIRVTSGATPGVAAPPTSNALPFVVNPPSISTLAPAGATVGAPAFTLTVNGANFVNNNSTSASQIFFGGSPLATTFVNSGTLRASITPAMIATPGPIIVVVVNPGGSRSNPATFTVSGAPILTSLNPSSIGSGSPAFPLIVNGTNLTIGMTVRFNGTALPTTCVGGGGIGTTLAPCVSGQLSTTVPANLVATPGTAQVSAITADGILATPTLPFTIFPGLRITTTALPDGIVGTNYSFTLTATGGTGTLTWAASGLPAVLTVNTGSGLISGIPANPGVSTVGVTVTDSTGLSASATFSLTINGKLTIVTSLPTGIVGVPYSAPLTAIGGTAPIVWTATGLPPGLMLTSPVSGLLTPQKDSKDLAGADDIAAAKRGSGAEASLQAPGCATFPSGFVPFDSVAYISKPNATGDMLLVGSMSSAAFTALQTLTSPIAAGQQYCGAVQLAAGISVVAYVPTPGERNGDFSQFAGLLIDPVNNAVVPGGIIPVGRLPGLMAWHISGLATGSAAITGIPTLAGTFNVTLTATDAAGQTATAVVPLQVVPRLLLPAPTLPVGIVGTSYSFTFTPVGGVPPFAWSISGLPGGLAIGAATGTISGIPTAAGTFPLTVTVQDASGQTAVAQVSLTVIGRLVITSGNLPGATAGQPFSFRLTAAGGLPPYVWSATGLAPGLTLNPQTGDITGIPTSASSGVVSVNVTDQSAQSASAVFSFRATPAPIPPLQIDTNSLPTGTVGIGYGAALAASGGVPEYVFSVAGGGLPPGILLTSTGGIGGAPTSAGTFSFTARVMDTAGTIATKGFVIVINPAPVSVTGAVSDVILGADFSFQFGATGGIPPYSFGGGSSLAGGTVSASGTFSGTATALGTFTVSVTATDSQRATGSRTFTFKVIPAPLVITTAALGNAAVGVGFSASFAAVGGVPPYTWSVDGGPGGLSFAGNVLSGTPTTAGNFTIGVTVTDSLGTKASKSFAITVASLLQITTASLGDGVVGSPYSASLAAIGGVTPYSFSASGLPDGVTAAANGAISGTPTARGTFQVSATATDANGTTATKAFTVTIAAAPLVITSRTLPNATVGTAYSAGLQASGGVAPYSWSASGLPNGITISSAGALSGTSTAAGTASLAVTVKDSLDATATATISLTSVLPPPPLVNVTGAPPTAGSAEQANLKVILDRSYPVDVTVTLSLTVAPVAGTPPQDVQFSNGQQTLSFVVPANTPPAATDVFLQVGTVAGTITVTERLTSGGQDITPTPAPTQTIQIAASVPVLTGNPSVTATRSATGFTVVATGFSNTREISQAIFGFTAASGATLQTSTVTIPGDTLFAPYYASAASNATGGSFRMTQAFTVQGNTQAITSVTLTLVNRIGSSRAVTVNLQ